MKKELHIFFTALMFYTRIPVPKWVNHDADYLNRASKYIPIIGWIVGGISGSVLIGAIQIFNPLTAILLSLLASVVVTGAFHEDGFADSCDGFGGGWSKIKILEIMKDSRVGTFGVVGLIILLGIKVSALLEILNLTKAWMDLLAISIMAHSLSRWVAATTIFTHGYSREDALSKIKPIAKNMTVVAFGLMFIFGVVPLVFYVFYTQNVFFLLVLPIVYASKVLAQRFFSKWIGGYTGDCLGAIQQISEVVLYLSVIIIWKFI